MRFAYADPPYPGQGHRYPEKTEVNSRELLLRLADEYPDGWALSTGSNCLADLLAPGAPPGIRIAAWVKPFAIFKPGVNPAYAWEPVLFSGGRKRSREDLTVVDWVSAPVTIRKGIVGAKPAAFCYWVLDLLGYIAGDTVDDLYPGTGIVSRIVAARETQMSIADGRRE